jgi:type III pantothenate kinase
MNLVIDSGNTSMKLGVFEGGKLREMISDLSLEGLKDVSKRIAPQNVIISSVNRQAGEISDCFSKTSHIVLLNAETRLPFKNLYKTPQTLGTDRLASVAGANKLYPDHHCLVIDAGTCIKFDFIDKENNYKGGSISPGLTLRFKALNNFTARLPLVEKKDEAELIGKSTEEAILSGVINGTLAEVGSMIDSYKALFPDLKVIICGGDASFFESKIKQSIFAVPELVLIGLNRILEYNVSKA